MVGKTHMIVGAASGLGVACAFGINPSVALIAAATVGALVPDIDHHNSLISTANPVLKIFSWFIRKVLLPVEAFLLNIVSSVLGKAGLPFSEAKASHRGPLTHSIVGVLLLSLFFAPVLAWNATVFVFIVIGMFSHIFVDMLNPEGSPVLYPITSKKISVLPHAFAITTGTKREELVKVIACFAIAFFLAGAFGMKIF